jgi:hypothetical protein
MDRNRFRGGGRGRGAVTTGDWISLSFLAISLAEILFAATFSAVLFYLITFTGSMTLIFLFF